MGSVLANLQHIQLGFDERVLYGVSRFDPFSFGVGAVVLLTVSVVACVVPMLRATGVDPAIAVRAE